MVLLFIIWPYFLKRGTSQNEPKRTKRSTKTQNDQQQQQLINKEVHKSSCEIDFIISLLFYSRSERWSVWSFYNKKMIKTRRRPKASTRYVLV